eukprot:TRINITY_DN93609_c0_g1_i1.p1 TRINITY_DN93609_c0_g1~~TRINITY_DN93609_c0_g1_i1.p1  ORF type:complete len:333 (-),score=53.71 TRINITY_DN93609_c0_g1_i1:1035-2033(-)
MLRRCPMRLPHLVRMYTTSNISTPSPTAPRATFTSTHTTPTISTTGMYIQRCMVLPNRITTQHRAFSLNPFKRKKKAPPVTDDNESDPALEGQTSKPPQEAKAKAAAVEEEEELTPPPQPGLGAAASSMYFYFKKYLVVNSIIAFVMIVCWVFYKGWRLMSSYSVLSAMKLGWILGFMSAFVAMGMGLVIRNWIVIHKDLVYRHVLKRVVNDPNVKTLLGGRSPKISSSHFTAYHETGGMMHKMKSIQRAGDISYKTLLATQPRRLQLLFQIESDQTQRVAMVSCDVHKKRRLMGSQLHYKSIAVDCMDTGDRVLLEGGDSDVIYKGIVKLR